VNLAGVDIPTWLLDWSGSLLVVVSLVYLFRKSIAYWHFSNASLVPYFALFVTQNKYMLAGLQTSYLVFGVHGLLLWRLEHRRDHEGKGFHEVAWYQAGWIMSLAIFAFAIAVTDFVDGWTWFQMVIVGLSLLANWATTRKWVWCWPVWLSVNAMQAVYFWHYDLTGLFALQFVLFAMSVYGWRVWKSEAASAQPSGIATVVAEEATHGLI
jgi:nicotinamide mononucleotide transporter